MTLQTSGPISFNDVNVEIGVAGTTTVSFDLAAVRELTPANSKNINAVAGQIISFFDLYGAEHITIVDPLFSPSSYVFTIFTNTTTPNECIVNNSTGTITSNIGSGATGTWWGNTGTVDQTLFECQMIRAAGFLNTNSGLALNTWYDMNPNVNPTLTWGYQNTSGLDKTFQGQLQIRRKSDTIIVDTANVNLTVNNS